MAQIIVALDNIGLELVAPITQELKNAGIRWLKVGLELFSKGGMPLVTQLKRQDFKIFLDLKLHDIPNTVAQTVRSIADSGVDLTTVHCLGGPVMMEAAAKAAHGDLAVVGVTLLTSHTDQEIVNICFDSNNNDLRKLWFLKLAKQAAGSGLVGVVSSPQELIENAVNIKKFEWSRSPYFVTPGIRFPENSSNDQSRISGPKEAVMAGSTHLVVGRPILQPASGGIEQAAKKFLIAVNEK